VASALGSEVAPCEVERFPDGELRPAVAEVRRDDVYVVQPTGPPVNEYLVELMLLLDACRRGGADRLTAVVPYFGYARQDRRAVPVRPSALVFLSTRSPRRGPTASWSSTRTPSRWRRCARCRWRC
jgi:phosphoribosylpyrophosphate synthetase